jgi:hypothetical protein
MLNVKIKIKKTKFIKPIYNTIEKNIKNQSIIFKSSKKKNTKYYNSVIGCGYTVI